MFVLYVLCGAVLLSSPSATSPSEALTAWDLLAAADPPAAEQTSPGERRILRALTADQARDFAAGSSPREIYLAGGETLAAALRATSGLSIDVFMIAGGHGVSVSGTFTVTGTIAHPATTRLSGRGYELVGGLMPLSSRIFGDGFESGDCSSWSQCAASRAPREPAPSAEVPGPAPPR